MSNFEKKLAMVEKIDGGRQDEWHWIRDENHLRRDCLPTSTSRLLLKPSKLQIISVHVTNRTIQLFEKTGQRMLWKSFPCLSLSVSVCRCLSLLSVDDGIGDDGDAVDAGYVDQSSMFQDWWWWWWWCCGCCRCWLCWAARGWKMMEPQHREGSQGKTEGRTLMMTVIDIKWRRWWKKLLGNAKKTLKISESHLKHIVVFVEGYSCV